jgi:hypothetical protein
MTAEHSIAPLAVDILPFVDETNCDISPPWAIVIWPVGGAPPSQVSNSPGLAS